MLLHFLGRGSAFADEHNSAFFTDGRELILLDCPATVFPKIKKLDLLSYDNVFVLVTHTHGDHISGLGMTLQYVWFASSMKKRITIVAPSDKVRDDLILLLNRIEGCETQWYEITTSDRLKRQWLIRSVPTKHTAPLAGRCFGYQLSVKGTNVVYTGDSATLEPFEPLLSAESYLYTEAAYFKSDVHLYICDALPKLKQLALNGVQVRLMHLDDEQKISEMISGTGIQLAPLYSSDN